MADDAPQKAKRQSSGSRRLRPKPELCRAKSLVGDKVVECLVQPRPVCYYALGFGTILLCKNPERMEIVVRTQAGQQQAQQ